MVENSSVTGFRLYMQKAEYEARPSFTALKAAESLLLGQGLVNEFLPGIFSGAALCGTIRAWFPVATEVITVAGA